MGTWDWWKHGRSPQDESWEAKLEDFPLGAYSAAFFGLFTEGVQMQSRVNDAIVRDLVWA